MSHIDSFKHQFVGQLGYLPVYRALEKISGDFHCDEGNLIVGGGSGEHPALVLDEPLAAVARFLDEEIENLQMDNSKKLLWQNAYKKYQNWNDDEILKFYEWGIEEYHNFYKMCTEEALPNPYFQENFFNVESWLILGFGEFIFFSMPSLADEILSQLSEPYKYFNHVSYNNILLYPPNIPVYANGGNAFSSTLKQIT